MCLTEAASVQTHLWGSLPSRKCEQSFHTPPAGQLGVIPNTRKFYSDNIWVAYSFHCKTKSIIKLIIFRKNLLLLYTLIDALFNVTLSGLVNNLTSWGEMKCISYSLFYICTAFMHIDKNFDWSFMNYDEHKRLLLHISVIYCTVRVYEQRSCFHSMFICKNTGWWRHTLYCTFLHWNQVRVIPWVQVCMHYAVCAVSTCTWECS